MFVDESKCLYCGGCVGVCPEDALTLREVVVCVDEEKCTKCGICVQFCPVGALSLEVEE